MIRLASLLLVAAAAAATVAASKGGPACAPLPRAGEHVRLDPASFVKRIDNRYLPLVPGSRWVYRETEADGEVKRVVVTVTRRTKRILGIRATFVHDVVTERGRLVEDTWDWYAQDRCGNVWYLGEDTKEYENGRVVSTNGSWQAGRGGGEAGVVMPAHPRDGLAYRQELLKGEAEDRAEILSVAERAEVPYGTFTRVLLTKEWTPLDPDVLEYKLYAKGVGLVLALGVSGGASREELLAFSRSG